MCGGMPLCCFQMLYQAQHSILVPFSASKRARHFFGVSSRMAVSGIYLWMLYLHSWPRSFLPFGNLTWLLKMAIYGGFFPVTMVIFYSHVKLPEGITKRLAFLFLFGWLENSGEQHFLQRTPGGTLLISPR